nr:unnamed protein product [Digitaria exilis]
MSTQSISPASASAQFTYPAAAAAAVAGAPSYFPVPFHLQYPQYAAWPAATAAPAVAPVPSYNAVFPMPQVQQAQQLFQKDSKIITPEALATVKAAIANSEKDKKVEATKKAVPRKAAGQSWEDPTLADWPESKYVGNRPIKLRKSTWKTRIDFEALGKGKTQPQKKIKLQKRSVLHK